MEQKSLQSHNNRDLKCMSFDELRLEAEILLKKYHSTGNRDEMRSISNRFSEIDAMLDDYQKQLNTTLNDAPEESTLDVVSLPTDASSFRDSIRRPDTDTSTTSNNNISESSSKLENIPMADITHSEEDSSQVALMEIESPSEDHAETQTESSTDEQHSQTNTIVLTDTSAPVSDLPAPIKKPTSALDLMPMPTLDLTPTEELTSAESDIPANTSTPPKKKQGDYKTSGDLQSALQSVWNLVSDSEAPEVNDSPPTAPATPVLDEAESHVTTSAPLIPPIQEETSSTDTIEPTPIAPIKSVVADIPKSVNEELPKFQTTPKCRICNRCGRETRLSREKCEHCSYVDASLGILDSVIAGDIKKVEEILVAKPLVITTRTSKHEWTLLHMAASGGNSRMVEMLIQKGISINAKNNNGKTPLHYAAGKGHKRIVEILLNNHADPSHEYMGEKALDMARKNGHAEVVQLLEKHGA